MTDHQTPDVDTLVTAAVIELLLYPGTANERTVPLAQELGIRLTEAQQDYATEAVLITLDQLAIPFVDSLPENLSARYRSDLLYRAEESHPTPAEDAPEV